MYSNKYIHILLCMTVIYDTKRKSNYNKMYVFASVLFLSNNNYEYIDHFSM